jgi:hypothetical protein
MWLPATRRQRPSFTAYARSFATTRDQKAPTLIVFSSVESDAKEQGTYDSVAVLQFLLHAFPWLGWRPRSSICHPAGKTQRKKAQCLLSTPAVCLKFEDDRRLAKFCDLL